MHVQALQSIKKDSTRYIEEDLVANMTEVRLGDRDTLDAIDEAADRRKRRFF